MQSDGGRGEHFVHVSDVESEFVPMKGDQVEWFMVHECSMINDIQVSLLSICNRIHFCCVLQYRNIVDIIQEMNGTYTVEINFW